MTSRRARLACSVLLGAAFAFVSTGSAVVQAEDVAPGQVQNLDLVQTTPTSIEIDWQPPTGNSTITSYVVEYSTDGASWTPFDNSSAPTATDVVITGLAAKTDYLVRVSAVDDADTGPSTRLRGAVNVAQGDATGCAVVSGGGVQCWGVNRQFQLGDGTDNDSSVPVHVKGIAKAVSVQSGDTGSCALLADRTVDCWGDVDFAGMQWEDGPHPLPGLSAVTSMSYGSDTGCAVVNSGSVYCWGQNPWAMGNAAAFDGHDFVRVSGLTNARAVSVGGETACALIADSTVKCWGFNQYGQLGNGTAKKSGTPVTVSGLSGVSQIVTGGSNACAVMIDSTVDCWGDNRNQQLGTAATGQRFSSTPVQVEGLHDVRLISITDEAICALITDGTVECVGADMAGDNASATPAAIPGIENAVGLSALGSAACVWNADGSVRCWGYLGNPTTRTDIYTLDPTPFSIGAVRTITAMRPDEPRQVSGSVHGTNAVIGWSPAESNNSRITSYRVQLSKDGGGSWTDAGTSTSTTLTVPAPAAGVANEYRVIAVNAVGASEPSDSVIVATPGTAQQQFTITTADGDPITGGTVFWKSADGNASGSQGYALTADGVVTLPRVVAGPGTLSLWGGTLPSGSLMDGKWDVALGTWRQTVQAPAEPASLTRDVVVTMPGGVPVVNASVSATAGFAWTKTIGDFNYQYGGTAPTTSSVTDGNGRARVSGWATKADPTAKVTYNDGVLVQSKAASLDSATTQVQLDYMPWLDVSSTSETTSVGNVSSFVFSAKPKGAKTRAAARAIKGISIAIAPPAGWKQNACKAKSLLSGTTNSAGRLRLTVCAAKSGVYKVKSHGAVPTKAITLRVKGAPPMAPTSLTAGSPKIGQASASWATPFYSGGATITSYTVTLTDGTTKRHVLVRASKLMRYTFTGLPRGTDRKILVAAVTKHGTGDAASAKVFIA